MPVCSCEAWRLNIEAVNSAFSALGARNPDTHPGYQGRQFEFCPWCGLKLKDPNPELDPKDEDVIELTIHDISWPPNTPLPNKMQLTIPLSQANNPTAVLNAIIKETGRQPLNFQYIPEPTEERLI